MIELISFLVWLALMLAFIYTLGRLLDLVAPERRRLSKGALYLLLVPIFQILWEFVVVIRLHSSAIAELYRYSTHDAGSAIVARRAGFVWATANLVATAIMLTGTWYQAHYAPAPAPNRSLMAALGLVALVISLVQFIAWIIYWVQMMRLRSQLRSPPRSSVIAGRDGA